MAHQLADRDVWIYTASVADMPLAQYLALSNFHAANGTLTPWTFIASNDETLAECRFMDLELPWVRSGERLWDVAIRFWSAECLGNSYGS